MRLKIKVTASIGERQASGNAPDGVTDLTDRRNRLGA